MSGPQSVPAGSAGVEARLPTGSTGAETSPAAARASQPIVAPGPRTSFSAGAAPTTQPSAARPIILPTQDAGLVTVREPIKRAGSSDEAFELRSLTPQQKERWRFKKNLILWLFGIIILGITIIVLLTVGPM
jgi:hypothetical protein